MIICFVLPHTVAQQIRSNKFRAVENALFRTLRQNTTLNLKCMHILSTKNSFILTKCRFSLVSSINTYTNREKNSATTNNTEQYDIDKRRTCVCLYVGHTRNTCSAQHYQKCKQKNNNITSSIAAAAAVETTTTPIL